MLWRAQGISHFKESTPFQHKIVDSLFVEGISHQETRCFVPDTFYLPNSEELNTSTPLHFPEACCERFIG